MSDVFNKEERSQIMRAIKSKNTKSTELTLIKLFKENHITGWRHSYNVKGHPDFVFLEKELQFLWTVVFGMATIAAIRAQLITLSIGQRNVKRICNGIERLRPGLKIVAGQLFEFGSAN